MPYSERTSCTANSVRERVPVLAKTLVRMFLTVLSLMVSWYAISLLLAPVATSAAISRSRRVKSKDEWEFMVSTYFSFFLCSTWVLLFFPVFLEVKILFEEALCGI